VNRLEACTSLPKLNQSLQAPQFHKGSTPYYNDDHYKHQIQNLLLNLW